MQTGYAKDSFQSNQKRELVCLSQKGDIACFTILFKHLEPVLYAKALQFLGCRSDAKDVLQDTFIKAFSRLGQLRDVSAFNTWMHSVLKTECLQTRRRQRRFVKDGNALQAGRTKSWDQVPEFERLRERKELHDGVMQWLSHLNEKKQAVILLRFFSAFNSYHEIAGILSIPVGTVRSRLAIARKELYHVADENGRDAHLCKVHGQGTSNELEEQFRAAWPAFYEGDRQRFLNLFKKDLHLRFTSGKKGWGLQRWAQEWDQDLESGVRFRPNQVVNSDSVMVVEGPIINPPDKPGHCPPYGSMVLFHHRMKVHKVHIHYALRK